MNNFSTTNFITIFLVISTVCFVIFNLWASYQWVEIELNSVLAGFVSAFIGFIIWKKWAKVDWSKFTKEEEKKIEKVEDKLENWTEEEKVDILLWTK